MADPASNNDGEAVQILRRLEPVLTSMDSRLGAVEADVKDLRTDMNDVRGEIRTLDSRVSRVEGQLSEMSAKTPTIWSVAALFAAINGMTVALGAALAQLMS